jgi:purine-nucleoside phosphorylase
MDTNAVPARARFEQASDYIRAHTLHRPSIGLILGSGLSSLAERITEPDILPYASIPHFPSPTVQGHSGRLVVGTLDSTPILVMQGRVHYYEGYTMQQLTFPVRVMRLLGLDTLIVTNAAGGLNQAFSPGDLMLISDHINLVGMAGHNPLMGPNDPSLGPRFPDLSQAYDPALRTEATQVAKEHALPVHQGVYAYLAGPSFETPTEVRFLRIIGADAVGMSTVPETIVARHMDMRVLGISGITNVHSLDLDRPQETSHSEVLEAGRVIAPRMISLIRGILKRL